MAGYSSTPLSKKLGLKEGSLAVALHAPSAYVTWIQPLPKNLELKKALNGPADFIHLFAESQKMLRADFPRCIKHLKKTGTMWVSWPKKSSKVPTDLDENVIREVGLQLGVVDVKVCAVSDIWSGLKFVYRIKDR